MIYNAYFKSPIGILEIKSSATHILSIEFVEESDFEKQQINDLIHDCILQLTAYFSHQLHQFELPLAFNGSAFQNKVWKELQQIPFSTTCSYLQFAKKLGDAKCIRAAAAANARNPFAIVVPCHRVIGSNGKLVGYAGGLWRKQWLLEHEQAISLQTKLF